MLYSSGPQVQFTSGSCWAVKWQTITHELPTGFRGPFTAPTKDSHLRPKQGLTSDLPPAFESKCRQVSWELHCPLSVHSTISWKEDIKSNEERKGIVQSIQTVLCVHIPCWDSWISSRMNGIALHTFASRYDSDCNVWKLNLRLLRHSLHGVWHSGLQRRVIRK
jgi:hypothetical protein